MREKKIEAYAKINLGLDVTGRRDNGYHDVDMIMQTVDIHDTVEIRIDAEDNVKEPDDNSTAISMEIHQDSYGQPLAADRDNLCIRAANALLDSVLAGIRRPGKIHIVLHKRIPIAAGMAGGSTDAAAVLRGLNELLGLGLSEDELCNIGVKLGADIPYCIMGGCKRARGIGEDLHAIEPIPKWDILVAKPPIAVSTAEVYKRSDAAVDIRHPDIDALEDAIKKSDIHAACKEMGNVLEQVTRDMHPVIGDIEAGMVAFGAVRAMMTGSGPTVFGIFEDEKSCQRAAGILKDKGICPEIFATKTI